MKKTSLLLALSLVCLIVISQKSLPFTFKLAKTYKTSNFDVQSEIQHFSQKLLEKGILNPADLRSPDAIYDKLQAYLPSAHPEELGIEVYIADQQLIQLKKDKTILKADNEDQVNIALFTYYQLFSAKYTEFHLEIKQDRSVEFEGEYLPISSFESVLFQAVEDRISRHVSMADVTFVLHVEPLTQMEFRIFIQEKLRELGLRKIQYK